MKLYYRHEIIIAVIVIPPVGKTCENSGIGQSKVLNSQPGLTTCQDSAQQSETSEDRAPDSHL